MSSSGGIGGGGTRMPTGAPGEAELTTGAEGLAPGGGESVAIGEAVLTADGQIAVGGESFPIDSPEGQAALQAALATAEGAAALASMDPEMLEDLGRLMHMKLVQTDDGPMLVPNDKFEAEDVAAKKKAGGPQDIKEGKDELDEAIGKIFTDNGIPDPYNANTTPDLKEKMKANGTLEEGVGLLKPILEDGTLTKGNLDGFADYMKRIEAQNPHGNIMEVLFLVFRESIESTNEDKKYFLTKLKMYNDMGEALSGYLSELVDVSRDLGALAAGQKYPEMTLTPTAVDIKKFDLSTTNKAGGLSELSSSSKRLDRAGLSDTIKEVESMQETVRNKRQMASTAFQNFDQKANQLYNLLSSVMKAMNEMRMGTVRNML